MGTPNVELAREYLRAVESMATSENVSRFYSADIEFHEFPNRIVPHGRVRKRADLQAAYGQGQKLLRSQRYDVRRVVDGSGIDLPRIVPVHASSIFRGDGWMGVKMRDASVVRGVGVLPIFAGLIGLLLLLGAFAATWLREGR